MAFGDFNEDGITDILCLGEVSFVFRGVLYPLGKY